MSRNGIGSASVVLTFTVLGMAVFTVISYISAENERVMILAEVSEVQAFYAADTVAEQVLSEALSSAEGAGTMYFVLPVSDTRELFAAVAIEEDYRILTWQVYYTGQWEVDDRLDVWREPIR